MGGPSIYTCTPCRRRSDKGPEDYHKPERIKKEKRIETKSLYERLGGYDAIAAITDDLLAWLLNDPQFVVFWKGHSENSLRRDRQLVVNFMCEAAGGPVFYTGRDMQTSHKGLGINASDWEVFMRHAAAAPEKFAVPSPERDEVLAFLTSLQGDIVERV